jgi:hypothetical protein
LRGRREYWQERMRPRGSPGRPISSARRTPGRRSCSTGGRSRRARSLPGA